MCKVLGCMKRHNTHLCRCCKNGDSDHFRSNCPFQCPCGSRVRKEWCCHSTSHVTPKYTGGRCRATGCFEKHTKHYCDKCDDTDYTHRAMDCPRPASRVPPELAARGIVYAAATPAVHRPTPTVPVMSSGIVFATPGCFVVLR